MFIRLLIISCILLSGCSPLVRYKAEPIERPRLSLSDPKPLIMRPIKFIVITPENASQVFNELESKSVEPVLIGLTGDGYKSLSLNVDDIKNYLELQREIIRLYRDYYEPVNDGKEKR